MGKNRGTLWKLIQTFWGSPWFWTVVVAVGTTIWAVLKGWLDSPFAPLLLPVLALVVGVTFWAVIQVKNAKLKSGLLKLSDKEIEKTIHEWVTIPKWSTRPLSNPDAKFVYILQHESISVLIARYKRDPKVIDLTSGFPTQQLQTVLSQSQWNTLTSQLKIEMCRLCIQWEFVEPIQAKEKSAFNLIGYVILDDFITGYQFRAKVMSVINAAILANELVNNALTQDSQQ